jgi:hypothetical protein
MNRLMYKAIPRQAQFHADPSKFRLYGGAMGGGKSYAGCAEAFRMSWKYPGNRGAIIRKQMTVLKRTTLQTFLRLIPSELIADYNRTEMRITLTNRSEIMFLEADASKDPLFNKLKSLEIGWFFIDEASEVSEGAFAILVSRLRWKLPDGSYPPRLGWMGANPENCWLKERFIDQNLPGYSFIPATGADNPMLPDDYLDDMNSIFTEDQKARYIEGHWDVADDPTQLISWQLIRDAIGSADLDKSDTMSIGLDVARYGDDASAAAIFCGRNLIELREWRGQSLDVTADKAERLIAEYKVEPRRVGVDGVGIGAGIVDFLRRKNLRVHDIISSERGPNIDRYRFNNLRSHIWWKFRQAIEQGTIIIAIPAGKIRNNLIQEIAAIRYRIDAEKQIKVEPKEDTKKRLSRSPDLADSAAYAWYVRTALPKNPAVYQSFDKRMW